MGDGVSAGVLGGAFPASEHGEDTKLTLCPGAGWLAATAVFPFFPFFTPSENIVPIGKEPTKNGDGKNYAENVSHDS